MDASRREPAGVAWIFPPRGGGRLFPPLECEETPAPPPLMAGGPEVLLDLHDGEDDDLGEGGPDEECIELQPEALSPPDEMVDVDEMVYAAAARGPAEPAAPPPPTPPPAAWAARAAPAARAAWAAWADLAVAALGEAVLGRPDRLRDVWGPLPQQAAARLAERVAAGEAAAADALTRLCAFADLLPPAEAARATAQLRSAHGLLEVCAAQWRSRVAAWSALLSRARGHREAVVDELERRDLAGLQRARDEMLARSRGVPAVCIRPYEELVQEEFARSGGAVRSEAESARGAAAAALRAELAALPAPARPPAPAGVPPPVLRCWSEAAELVELRGLISLTELAERVLPEAVLWDGARRPVAAAGPAGAAAAAAAGGGSAAVPASDGS